MAEDASFVDETIERLKPVVDKPALEKKFLSRPPYRYLFDIIRTIQRKTEFGDGLFNEDDLDSGKAVPKGQQATPADRNKKINFLNKVIKVCTLVLKRPCEADPKKIIAGKEPELTNKMLIMFLEAAQKVGKNSASIVAQVNGTEEEKKEEKPAPAPKPKPKQASSPEKKPSEDENKESNSQKQPPKQQEKQSKPAPKPKSSSPPPSEQQKPQDKPSQQSKPKSSAPRQRPPPKSTSPLPSTDQNDKPLPSQKSRKEDNPPPSSPSPSPSSQQQRRPSPSPHNKRENKNIEEENAEERAARGRELDLEREKMSQKGRRRKRGDSGDDTDILTNDASDALGLGPTSAEEGRRNLPGLQLKGMKRKQGPGVTDSDSEDDSQPDEEEAALRAQFNRQRMNNQSSQEKEPKSKLAREIEEQQRMLEKGREGGGEKKDDEEARKAAQEEALAAEAKKDEQIAQIREGLQEMVKGVMPLGRVEYLQTDLEIMSKEFNDARKENLQHVSEFDSSKRETDVFLHPLQAQLCEVEQAILDEKKHIFHLQSQIQKNELQIASLMKNIMSPKKD